MGFDLPGEGKLGMSDEIKMPEGVAKAVVDAIEWMANEGQWFEDPEQGEKLLAYLRVHHPKIVQKSWCLHRKHKLLNEVRMIISDEIAYVDDMASTPMTEEQEKRIAAIIRSNNLPPTSDVMTPSEPEVNTENSDD